MYEEQNQNVRNSIAVYKTDRKLVELRDKLNPSFWGNYAELHGHADVDGNGKVYSNIGVVLYDYSNGTGNNTVKVYVNVTPEDIYWLYNALTSHTENFELEQTKIFGQPDNNGYSQMTKLRIARAGVDKNGDARRYPWCITAENGVGIAQHTKVGGTYCKSGSYQSIRKAPNLKTPTALRSSETAEMLTDRCSCRDKWQTIRHNIDNLRFCNSIINKILIIGLLLIL